MKTFIFLLLIVVVCLLQVSVIKYVAIAHVRPDLLCAFLLFINLAFGMRQAMYISMFTGVLKDTFSAAPFGMYTFLYVLLSFLIAQTARRISIENYLYASVTVAGIVLVNDLIVKGVYTFLGSAIPLGAFLRISSLEAVYTAAIVPVLFKVVHPLLHMKALPKDEEIKVEEL